MADRRGEWLSCVESVLLLDGLGVLPGATRLMRLPVGGGIIRGSVSLSKTSGGMNGSGVADRCTGVD